MSHQRRVDVQDGDEKWVEGFEYDIEMLAGLVEEMFVENKAALLSQTFRHLIRDRGRLVMEKLRMVKGRIAIDNLGKPLGGPQ